MQAHVLAAVDPAWKHYATLGTCILEDAGVLEEVSAELVATSKRFVTLAANVRPVVDVLRLNVTHERIHARQELAALVARAAVGADKSLRLLVFWRRQPSVVAAAVVVGVLEELLWLFVWN